MSAGKLTLSIALFVLAGVPFVAYIWETANRAFAGNIDGVRMVIALAALVVFLGLLRMLARTLTSWEARRFD
jgi:hypothetical protein